MGRVRIPTSELFTDLQVSLTEIFLIELFDSHNEFGTRFDGNVKIVGAIKKTMLEQFYDNDIVEFLESGFPRQVNLRNII